METRKIPIIKREKKTKEERLEINDKEGSQSGKL